MKTKCPKQLEHFPKEKDHPYVLCPKINFIPKMHGKVLRTH
jgi:hypothetical protein